MLALSEGFLGLELSVTLSTALVDFFAKWGALELASFVFDKMKDRNVITWIAMFVGLAQNGLAEDASKLFSPIQEKGVAVNSTTLVSLVHSCAHLGFLRKGKSIHVYLIRHGFIFDVVDMTALIDMYAKCGKIQSAESLFNNNSITKDVISFNSMITGYALHGQGNQAVSNYFRMIKEGIMPNHSTFLSPLTACSHSGLVEDGITLFHRMKEDHKLGPTEKHYSRLVDVLGKAGRVEEARALIRKMPFEPSSAVLETFLSGCRLQKNITMGIKVADRLLHLDAMNTAVYVVLSNMYAEARRWDKVDYIRGLMRKHGVKKTPAYSSF
ncbi:Pentatricopeptide repeat [Dillenia turbinata]|uniref:Pentatricopeptide repeat n=1 Tax=Dillenia turbinata TaxID=194707 RepID=A0AAN8ZLD2_9MAGN